MSREHKYRAWHSGNKYGEGAEMLFGRPDEVFRWLQEGQPVTIEQWTGLTDKNGTSIFEGDIVRIEYHHDQWPIIYKTASFGYIDRPGKINEQFCRIGVNHSDDMEVIGNIHTDKEES